MNIRPVGAEMFPADGRTIGRRDRRTWRNKSRVSQLCEGAWKWRQRV